MNNENEIKKTEELLGDCLEMEGRWDEGDEIDYHATAENLINRGIGDKKRAVEEFIETLKFNLEENCVRTAGFDLEDVELVGAELVEQIENTFNELYGEDKE